MDFPVKTIEKSGNGCRVCNAANYKEKIMSTNRNQQVIDDVTLKKIIETLNSLRFGSITITVHNSKVVQIERVEKTRFDRETVGAGEGI